MLIVDPLLWCTDANDWTIVLGDTRLVMMTPMRMTPDCLWSVIVGDCGWRGQLENVMVTSKAVEVVRWHAAIGDIKRAMPWHTGMIATMAASVAIDIEVA